MREILQDLADDTGYTLEQAVAVLAVTSPRVQLRTNLDWTRLALESRGRETVGRYPNQMMPKIRAILADPAVAHAWATGPKCGAFYRAILGDPDALVLDVWATLAGTGSRELDAATRKTLEAAYRAAAKRARQTVRDFQAAVWIAVRESTPNGRTGTVHNLADITA